jgi:hypothetical protein
MPIFGVTAAKSLRSFSRRGHYGLCEKCGLSAPGQRDPRALHELSKAAQEITPSARGTAGDPWSLGHNRKQSHSFGRRFPCVYPSDEKHALLRPGSAFDEGMVSVISSLPIVAWS